MQVTHSKTISKYDEFRKEARSIAKDSLPGFLKKVSLDGIDQRAMAAFRTWQHSPERKVDWDWNFSARYCVRYPKAFDLAVWNQNSLLSLTLGRPTFKGKSIRMDFIERAPNQSAYSGYLFTLSQIAYETYGRLIGADFIRLMEPMNDKLISHYTSKDGGFELVAAKQGNPHYLVKKL